VIVSVKRDREDRTTTNTDSEHGSSHASCLKPAAYLVERLGTGSSHGSVFVLRVRDPFSEI
jgi:hypothetical protein